VKHTTTLKEQCRRNLLGNGKVVFHQHTLKRTSANSLCLLLVTATKHTQYNEKTRTTNFKACA